MKATNLGKCTALVAKYPKNSLNKCIYHSKQPLFVKFTSAELYPFEIPFLEYRRVLCLEFL